MKIVAGTALAILAATAVAVVVAAFASGDTNEVPTANARVKTATTTTPTTLGVSTSRTCRAPLTADAPLRLWIAGDSLAFTVGNGLGKPAAATGVVAPVYESRVSSGLASPTFFDWPKRVNEELARLDPEVVVFVMGTNDYLVPQPTPVDANGAPVWKARYTALVQQMVDTLTQNGRTLYWVAPPVLKDAPKEAGAKQIAEVMKTVVEQNPNARFVDLHALTDADDGSYSATVDVNEKKVTIRSGDGVHFSMDGAEYVGAALFDLLDAQCRLSAQSVPNSKQVVVETRGSTSVPQGATATAPPVNTPSATSPPATTSATSPPATAPPATTPPTTPVTVAPTTPVTTPPTTAGQK